MLACTQLKAFLPIRPITNALCGLATRFVNHLHFCLIIYLLDTVALFTVTLWGIHMGINRAPLIADLFLYCYESDFMLSLSPDTQSDIIDSFNDTSRYLDDILNLDNPFFSRMVDQIYPSALTLNKANSSDFEAVFLDLRLSIINGCLKTKIYIK